MEPCSSRGRPRSARAHFIVLVLGWTYAILWAVAAVWFAIDRRRLHPALAVGLLIALLIGVPAARPLFWSYKRYLQWKDEMGAKEPPSEA